MGENVSKYQVDEGFDDIIINAIRRGLFPDRFKICALKDAFAALGHFDSNHHRTVIFDIRISGLLMDMNS
jgi:hypothetical protein